MVSMSDVQSSGQRVLQQLLTQQGAVAQQILQTPNNLQTSVSVPDVAEDEEGIIVDPNVRLELFSEVLDEIDGGVQQTESAVTESTVLAQALPLAVSSYQDPLQVGIGGKKESMGSAQTVNSAELPGGIQYAEVEHAAELPPEVENYIEQVVDHAQTQPETVVVAEVAPQPAPSATAPQRVVKVLPLTKMQEEIGLKKNPKFSVRWLVEFSHKIAKMFFGGVIYRQSE